MLMTRNVFQFGDTYWKQNDGTAMGSPPAPTYENISFALYKILFLPLYTSVILYYKQYIDDIFCIWKPDPDVIKNNTLWNKFKKDLNGWYGLTWDEPQPSKSVVFLDITLMLQNNKIHSTLYKKLNMHLYIPP